MQCLINQLVGGEATFFSWTILCKAEYFSILNFAKENLANLNNSVAVDVRHYISVTCHNHKRIMNLSDDSYLVLFLLVGLFNGIGNILLKIVSLGPKTSNIQEFSTLHTEKWRILNARCRKSYNSLLLLFG